MRRIATCMNGENLSLMFMSAVHFDFVIYGGAAVQQWSEYVNERLVLLELFGHDSFFVFHFIHRYDFFSSSSGMNYRHTHAHMIPFVSNSAPFDDESYRRVSLITLCIDEDQEWWQTKHTTDWFIHV